MCLSTTCAEHITRVRINYAHCEAFTALPVHAYLKMLTCVRTKLSDRSRCIWSLMSLQRLLTAAGLYMRHGYTRVCGRKKHLARKNLEVENEAADGWALQPERHFLPAVGALAYPRAERVRWVC